MLLDKEKVTLNLLSEEVEESGARLCQRLEDSRRAIVSLLQSGVENVVLMFSGGKDSTTTVIVTLETFLSEGISPKEIWVIYSDTTLEIPTIHEYAMNFLSHLQTSERLKSLPLNVFVARPAVPVSFWVSIIGRGYPVPRPRFRWCTRRLKVEPAQGKIKELAERGLTAVFTGVRFGESKDRDRRLVLSCKRGGECGQGVWFEHHKRLNVIYFAPIAYWQECDVWDFLNYEAPLLGYPTAHLEKEVYGGRETRFGCWCCTVVRQDTTLSKIVARDGFGFLQPLRDFRKFLVEVCANPANRVMRPDGKPGRLKIEVRKQILDKLLETQRAVGLQLISQDEIDEIKRLWESGDYGDTYQKEVDEDVAT